MHSAAAGMAIFTPIIKRDAGKTVSARERRIHHRLTYVAPNWSPVYSIVAPNDGIYKLIKACQGKPKHIDENPGVLMRNAQPCQREKGRHKTKKRKNRERGISWVQHMGHEAHWGVPLYRAS